MCEEGGGLRTEAVCHFGVKAKKMSRNQERDLRGDTSEGRGKSREAERTRCFQVERSTDSCSD